MLGEPDLGLRELQAGHSAPEFSLACHRLDVAVPFQSKGSQTQLNGCAHFILGFGVVCQQPYGVDLAIPVTLVLLCVKSVSFRRSRGKAVVAG